MKSSGRRRIMNQDPLQSGDGSTEIEAWQMFPFVFASV